MLPRVRAGLSIGLLHINKRTLQLVVDLRETRVFFFNSFYPFGFGRPFQIIE